MREKAQVLNEFALKLLAILFMTFDHIGVFLYNEDYFVNNATVEGVGLAFRIIGRFAFPLFAFMLAEGLHKTHDRGNYLLRLALIWVLLTGAEAILFQMGTFSRLEANAFTDLLCFALFITLLEKKNWLKYLCILPLSFLILSYSADISDNYQLLWSQGWPLFLRAGYSLYGFLIFLGFYYAYPLSERFIKKSLEMDQQSMEEYAKSKEYRSLINLVGITFFLVFTVIFWAIGKINPAADPYEMGFESWCLLDIFLFVAYNGKRGYDKKWFRYAEYLYYPLHLALLGLIFGLLFKA